MEVVGIFKGTLSLLSLHMERIKSEGEILYKCYVGELTSTPLPSHRLPQTTMHTRPFLGGGKESNIQFIVHGSVAVIMLKVYI